MRAGYLSRPFAEVEPIIDLGLGEVRLGLEPREAPAHGTRYAPPEGFTALRTAIGARHGVPLEHVTITTGASMALSATLASLQRPASVLVPRPYFPAYPAVLDILGMTPLFYPVSSGATSLTVADLTALLRADTRAIVINFPGNPLGNVTDAGTLAAIAEFAAGHDLIVISDEVYADFVYDAEAAVIPANRQARTVHIRSFSKVFGMPGDRLGYAVSSPELTERITRMHWQLAMCAPAPAQVRAAQLLLADLKGSSAQRRATLMRNRDKAVAFLSEAGIQVALPQAGVFLWLQLETSAGDSRALAQRCLRDAGVVVAAGADFGVGAPVCLRVSFAVEPDDLMEGVRRLAGVLCATAA